MSKITLYYTPLSPPSRTILTVAEAIGLDLEKKNVDLFKGEHLTPEYTKVKQKILMVKCSPSRLTTLNKFFRSYHNVQSLQLSTME